MQKWLMRLSLAVAMILAAAAPLAGAWADAADPAAPAIQAFYATLVNSMRGGKALGAQGRYNLMRPAVEQAFEFGTMIKYAVGPTWSTASAGDQKALTEAFGRMTVAQYAGNFDSFTGESFRVDPKADIRGTDHYVKTAMVTKDQAVTFIYRMRQFGNNWKIIDILLDGSISQLSVYRSDFAATLKSGGAQVLVKKINDIADRALKG